MPRHMRSCGPSQGASRRYNGQLFGMPRHMRWRGPTLLALPPHDGFGVTTAELGHPHKGSKVPSAPWSSPSGRVGIDEQAVLMACPGRLVNRAIIPTPRHTVFSVPRTVKGPSGHRCSTSLCTSCLCRKTEVSVQQWWVLGSDHQTVPAQHVHPAQADQCAWQAWCNGSTPHEPRHTLTLHTGQEHMSRLADASAWSSGIAVPALRSNIAAATAKTASSSASAARRGARRFSARPR